MKFMNTKKLNIKNIKKKIEKVLKDNNWQDFETNYSFSGEKVKYDYLLKVGSNFKVGVKLNNNTKISKRMITIFINQVKNSKVNLAILTNGKSLIIYDNSSKELITKDFKDFPSYDDYASLAFENLLVFFKKYYLVIPLIAIVLLFAFLEIKIVIQNNKLNAELKELNTQESLKEAYEECKKATVITEDTDAIKLFKDELDKYLNKNYNVSVLYQNIDYGYNYVYNNNATYYAASTIKTIDALYLYNKALNNELDLETKVTLSSEHYYSKSELSKKYKSGDKVSLREYVKYLIMYSDNSAHMVLVDYIGLNNLKNYAHSMGVNNCFVGDNFGNINLNDALVYMQNLYDFINKDNDLAKELKSYFVNSQNNDLKITDINLEAATKYGYYGSYFHNIGIVLDREPYIAVVLTKEGNKDYDTIVKNISLQIYKLHKLYMDTKSSICYEQIYLEK